jgi:mercuric ion binding protein
MTRFLKSAALFVPLILVATMAFAGPTKYRMRVDGLACPFCAYGIEKELKASKGVESIDTDINAGTVTVTMAEGATLTEARARRIVKEAGFTLGAFEKLDGATHGTEE